MSIENEVEAGEGYRLLEVGEEIKEGDEVRITGSGWIKSEDVGLKQVNNGIERRRKLEHKTPDCPFEVGKEYPMRGGGVFRVYATDAGGPKPIHGATKCSDGWAGGSRTVDGCMYADRAESAFDIILPKPIADDAWPDCIAEGTWYARDSDGNTYLYEREPFEHEGGACWDVSGGVSIRLFDALFPNFPHPPADMPGDQTKCQKPKRKNNESI